MKIAITGASGFVGRSLVPELARHEAVELLLIGRNVEVLEATFPGFAVCHYRDMQERAASFDRLVHLAVMNNDVDADYSEFREVNVSGTLEIARIAAEASIEQFVNVSSTHALDLKNQSFYALSKREAINELRDVDNIDVATLYLPAVYGDRWSGQLSFLNRLPRGIALNGFKFLAALRPTVHVSRIADYLIDTDSDACRNDFILSDGQEKNRTYRFFKRCMDVAFALVIAIFFWWLLLLIWVAVKAESSGPGVFSQKRVGKNGRIFTCYKFRTMKAGTSQAGTHEISQAQVTSVGAFLRRTKLDELPQILNIFRGEIGLIGPRPCLPVQTELIKARQQRRVDKALPGISGLAQINDIDMSKPELLAQWDEKYLALQSILLDVKIVLATAFGRGGGDRVSSQPT